MNIYQLTITLFLSLLFATIIMIQHQESIVKAPTNCREPFLYRYWYTLSLCLNSCKFGDQMSLAGSLLNKLKI